MKYPKNQQKQYQDNFKMQLKLEQQYKENNKVISDIIINIEFEKLKQLIINKLK